MFVCFCFFLKYSKYVPRTKRQCTCWPSNQALLGHYALLRTTVNWPHHGQNILNYSIILNSFTPCHLWAKVSSIYSSLQSPSRSLREPLSPMQQPFISPASELKDGELLYRSKSNISVLYYSHTKNIVIKSYFDFEKKDE